MILGVHPARRDYATDLVVATGSWVEVSIGCFLFALRDGRGPYNKGKMGDYIQGSMDSESRRLSSFYRKLDSFRGARNELNDTYDTRLET